MRQLTVNLTDDTHAALKAIAARRRMNLGEAGLVAINEWVDRGGSGEAESCRALMSSIEDGQRAIADFISSVLSVND